MGLVPIIALTANAVLGVKEMFLEKGFSDFLAKPIDLFRLDEILGRWISKEKRENSEWEIEKKLVSLVDNNPSNLRAGINALEEKYDTITAPSAEKMLKILENNSPAIILLSDTEIDKILKSNPQTKHIPVVFISEPFNAAELTAYIDNHFQGVNK
jgi:CheY-like chemotaxis protein